MQNFSVDSETLNLQKPITIIDVFSFFLFVFHKSQITINNVEGVNTWNSDLKGCIITVIIIIALSNYIIQ